VYGGRRIVDGRGEGFQRHVGDLAQPVGDVLNRRNASLMWSRHVLDQIGFRWRLMLRAAPNGRGGRNEDTLVEFTSTSVITRSRA